MKFIILILALLALTLADPFDDMKGCLAERCPTQYQKCMSTSGCEDKLRKCADKCGLKVNQTCWTFCIGLPGVVANTALCAVNQKCIANSRVIDRVGLNLMTAVDAYLNQ